MTSRVPIPMGWSGRGDSAGEGGRQHRSRATDDSTGHFCAGAACGDLGGASKTCGTQVETAPTESLRDQLYKGPVPPVVGEHNQLG